MAFEKGDLVQLKSGGPVMTVEQIGERYTIDGTAVGCVWFEKVGAKQVALRETFSEVVLEKAERPGVTSSRIVRG